MNDKDSGVLFYRGLGWVFVIAFIAGFIATVIQYLFW